MQRRAGEPALDVREERAAALDVDQHRGDRVADRERVRALALRRAGERDDVRDVRRELDEERQPRRRARGAHDGGERPRIGAERGAALVDVGARDVELDRRAARLGGEAARDLGVFPDGAAPDVADRRDAERVQERQALAGESLDAGPLQSDRVEDAAADLRDARLRVARARVEPHALAGDRPELREVDPLRVFAAEAERPRGDRDRILHPEAAEVHRQIGFVHR